MSPLLFQEQQEARAKEFDVARLHKRPESDPSGRLRMTNAASEGPSLRTSLLLKDGLHVQSEDQHVFVYADLALFS